MKKLASSLLFILAVNVLFGQVYLQIEKRHSFKKIILETGQTINYKTVEYKDTWRKETIEKIIPEANTIILGGVLIKPEDIFAIRLERKPFMFNLGTQFQRLGLTLLVYGGIIELSNIDDFGWEGVAVSAGFAGLGTLMKAIFKKRVYRFGKKNRLRVVDVRMFVPDQ